MKHKKLFFLIPIPIIIAVFVILIQPKETLIQETMRFYGDVSADIGSCPDDTDFGGISEKYVDVSFDIKVLSNVFSADVKGTMEIGGEKYYVTNTSVTDDSGMGGILARAHKEKRAMTDISHLRFSDDLEFIELYIDEGDTGLYFNCSTLGEYREGIKKLYPFLEFDTID